MHRNTLWADGTLNPSSPLVDHKYSTKWADISQTHQFKVAWRTFSLTNLLPDSLRYFSSLFFFFFLSGSQFFWWALMLWPYAESCNEDNRPQCADRPRLPPLSPSFPSISLPSRATDRLLWEPSTALMTRAGSKPPFLQRYLPLTSTSHCPSLCSQPTPKPVFLPVWLKRSLQNCAVSAYKQPVMDEVLWWQWKNVYVRGHSSAQSFTEQEIYSWKNFRTKSKGRRPFQCFTFEHITLGHYYYCFVTFKEHFQVGKPIRMLKIYKESHRMSIPTLYALEL